MILEKYDNYKDSGVEWLGDIPEGWDVKRVKDVSFVVLGKMLDNVKQENNFLKPYLKSKNITWQNVNLSSVEEMYFSSYELKKYKLKYSDLLLSEGGEVGKTSVWKDELDECYIQNSVHKITINANNDYRYFYYISLSLGKRGYYDSIVNIVSIKHLTREKLICCFWLRPPTKQLQTKIANFLDKKTSQIDSKIKLLKEKITSYKELKKSLINETVCRGLNKNVELKDSNVEWVGKIPKEWNVDRGKNLFYELEKSKIPAKEGLKKGEYKFFTSSKNQTKWINQANQKIKDIIFSTGGTAGVHYCDELHEYSTDCWALSSNKISLKYYYYYYLSILFEIHKLAFKGTGINHLQKDFIKLGSIPNPIKQQQTAIAKYLDKKTSKIDSIITKLKNQVTTLTEFRKTLINDIVTGKIKVPE
ncbi:hypothetical protein HN836_02930 [Candidatus Woesearchaeota archaeon]|jgi:type I restriction enzyme, S subunit|nr:hypothetical protein [Candidatus Woesearchaeota archaeon]MBT7296587.1 hypothetical protein [Candidatus Woesearchaeota archaeon]